MKARWLAVFSVALNLVLLAAVASTYWRQTHAPILSNASGVREVTIRSAMAEPVTTTVSQVETNVAVFHWNHVASQDFTEYRDRLLAMGCPQRTMRVIVLSEINEKYNKRLEMALAHLQARFWDLMAEGPQKLESACSETAKDIQDEREKVISDVLGDEKPDETELAESKVHQLEMRRAHYAWLPEDKRDEMIALEDKFSERRAEMWRVSQEQNSGGVSKKEQKAKIEALEQQLTDERKQLLTSEENEEYELRNSNASHWAANACGFEPTEEEWRAVARLQKQRDDAWEALNLGGSATSAEKQMRAAERKKIDDQLAAARGAVLGPERTALFERGNDQGYKQVRAITQRYGLDDAVANHVCELQREAVNQANALREDTSLDAAVRDETLAAIVAETRRTLEQTMGAKAFSTYQKYDNGWFDRLGAQ